MRVTVCEDVTSSIVLYWEAPPTAKSHWFKIVLHIIVILNINYIVISCEIVPKLNLMWTDEPGVT